LVSLGRNNFYQEKRTGLLFSLANPELVANVALKYKLRLIDKNVNNFIDMVQEL
jgi:hypothetical protein